MVFSDYMKMENRFFIKAKLKRKLKRVNYQLPYCRGNINAL